MVPKWSPDGPKSGLEGDWGAAGKAYVDQVAPQTGAGGAQKKKLRKKRPCSRPRELKRPKIVKHCAILVSDWSQNGPKMVPKGLKVVPKGPKVDPKGPKRS